jgi:predicted DCC family thiol-disulfide oxidoreductase YuxK
MDRIVLFDGVCNLCNHSVQFIIKRDPEGQFHFASLEGEVGQKLIHKFGLRHDINSFVLIEKEKVYVESTAALRVCRGLSGAWKYLSIFLITPRPLRDHVYRIIANNRYRWFGKADSCMLPLPEWRNRFLD